MGKMDYCHISIFFETLDKMSQNCIKIGIHFCSKVSHKRSMENFCFLAEIFQN